MTSAELKAFEKRVAKAFEEKKIKGPVHLAGGNEDQLIEIFKDIHPEDWVFTSYRNHLHALLHGVPEKKLFDAICAGHSMTLQFAEHRFFSTAIVAGQLPIACGVAAALQRKRCHRKVWCFIGDMAATTGIADEVCRYAQGHDLPLRIVVEDNGYSTDAPTHLLWATSDRPLYYERYHYERQYPHVGSGKWVSF